MIGLGDLSTYAKASCAGYRLVQDSSAGRALHEMEMPNSTELAINASFMFFCAIMVMFMQYGFAAVRYHS